MLRRLLAVVLMAFVTPLFGSEKAPDLPAGAVARLGRASYRHRGEVVSMVFSPDGKRLATAARDSTLIVWDMASGQGSQRASLRPQPVLDLTFRPDGKTIVVHYYGQEPLQLVDSATGAISATKVPTDADLFPAAVSRDGRLFAKGSIDRAGPKLRIWNLASGDELAGFRQVLEDGWFAQTLYFSADGRTLLALRSKERKTEHRITLWETATGKERLDVKLVLQEPRVAVHFDGMTADGRFLVVRQDYTLCLLDAATGRETLRLTRGEMPPTSRPVFAPDSSLMVVPGVSWKAGLWEPAAARKRHVLAGAEGEGVTGPYVFAPDSKTLVSSSESHRLVLWDAALGRRPRLGAVPLDGMRQVFFAPDGKTLVTGQNDGSVRFWETATLAERFLGRLPAVFQGFSPDGKVLAIREGTTTSHWDAATGKPAPKPAKLAPAVDQRLLRTRPFTSEFSRETRTFAAPDGKTNVTIRCDATPSFGPHSFQITIGVDGAKPLYAETWRMLDSFQFSADGQFLALRGRQRQLATTNTLALLNLATGKLLAEPKGLPGAGVFSLAPAGKRAAGAGPNGDVLLWELESAGNARLLTTGDGPKRAPLVSLNFSADGNILVAAAADGTVAAWDAATGRRVLAHKGPAVRRIVCAPEGQAFISEYQDGTVLLWNVAGLRAR